MMEELSLMMGETAESDPYIGWLEGMRKARDGDHHQCG
jgi:hypothetical protein